MNYDDLRHFADSWGLLAMALLFLFLVAWPFRRGARRRNEDAAKLIFKDDEHG
ncbi:cbb3-type cytochrome c oxidase subunit 3 [Sphingopyxis alaskensis]|jgi:cytochrome c oxidase cbb3-type subunit IV|uniref:Cbb3-type cytochrome oxidase component n=1 Tax=Sphingopyxis alaskensis (strain DSM 13593 / LMG 18877 / RB2256) TaxID=317655 RepID=Q1GSI5_SPHAL|nr:cbb3-type cytochrome c oxidase subunit 3 [Sphingopyxis alaskensis]ABF53387.1 Cbb3-type cytochrome oxidase component [Sphingopyxis alaskensis RB2256]MCM3419828.1 cbb3-type cytochrome c oxidase subunit 3 [Sphingopyxis alaskensis]